MRIEIASWIVALCCFCAGRVGSQPPDTLWTRQYGGIWDEYASGVCIASDNGILISGAVSDTILGNTDALLMKLDSQGNFQWQTRYGGQSDEVFDEIKPTPDDGSVMVGFTDSYGLGNRAAYIVRSDYEGDTLWTRAFSGTGQARFHDVLVLPDGFLAAGFIENAFGKHFYAVRLTSMGETIWIRLFERGPLGVDDEVYKILTMSDGGFLILGHRSNRPQFPNLRKHDAYIIRTTAEGDTIWTQTIGNSSDDEVATAADLIDSQCVIIAGTIRHAESEYKNILIIRLTLDGDTIWTREFNYDGLNNYATSVYGEATGEFVISGFAEIWRPGQIEDLPILVRFNALGDTIWKQAFAAPQSFSANASIKSPQADYLVVGTIYLNVWPFTTDIWLMRTEAELSVTDHWDNFIANNVSFQACYPNPFNSTTQIEFTLPSTQRVSLRLYDVLGREVAQLVDGIKTAGEHHITFDAAGLASGVYLCRIEAGEFAQTRKMILLK